MQADLFPPEGFRYVPDFLDAGEEERLLAFVRPLPFKPFEFHGYLGNRQVVSFGWKYDYGERRLADAPDMPPQLAELAERAAKFLDRPPDFFVQALVTEYAPGAAIGWHRDKREFGEVAGLSLLSPCRLRFRRAKSKGWERYAMTVAPRSLYVMQGAARSLWEHSIPAVTTLRYSITLRSLAQT
jgi:alkylated DNA repair dioxygenase AlkB